MGQYLIDNNVISGYFEGSLNENAMLLIEALSWISADKTKEVILQTFIADANILILTNDVVDQCVKIRRSKKIKSQMLL
jgi:hypothetical protein